MHPEEFQRSFRPAPIYVFAGDEDFYKVEGLAQIRSALFGKDADDSGLVEFNADDVDMATVLDELRTFSLFGGDRLVILNDADKFFGLKKKQSGSSSGTADSDGEADAGGNTKKYRELLLKYLESPVQGSTLIVTTQCSWGSTGKLGKKVQEVGFLVECRKPYSNKIPQWLTRRAQMKYQKRLVGGAAQFLADNGGDSLLQLDGQLAKLATFVGDRPQIIEEDAHELVGHGGYQSIFNLTDAAAMRDAARALGILRDLLYHGAAESYVITMLAWQFRRLWNAKKLELANVSSGEIESKLKVPPFLANKFRAQLRRFTEPDLRRNHRLLLEADLAMKSGHHSEIVLDQLIVRMCK